MRSRGALVCPFLQRARLSCSSTGSAARPPADQVRALNIDAHMRRLNLARCRGSSRNQRKSRRMLMAVQIVGLVTEDGQERH